jgi:hypothetical protein
MPKRLTNPSLPGFSRREALLNVPAASLAARAALLGIPVSVLAANEALADTAFTSFRFSATGTSAKRTMPDRLLDIINVKDFGALGNNSNDDTASIQAAVDYAIAHHGGIIFFPPGTYLVSSKIVLYGVQGLWLVGCGGLPDSGAPGSTLLMNARDYIFYIGHGPLLGGGVGYGDPIRGMHGLCLKNAYSGADPTSTEPPNSPDGCSGPAGTEGHGGIYVGTAQCSSFTHCNIQIGTGIGLCLIGGIPPSISNFTIDSNWSPGGGRTVNTSIGIISHASRISCGKINNLGTGLVCFRQTQIVEFLDIENCGYGISIGYMPLSYFDFDLGPGGEIEPPGNQPSGGIFHSIGIESPQITGVYAYACGASNIQGLNCASYSGTPTHGLWSNSFVNNVLENVQFSGAYTTAVIDIGNGAQGNTFRNVVTNAGQTPKWILPPVTIWDAWPQHPPFGQSDLNRFDFCDTDGAIPIAKLPSFANQNTTTSWVTDSMYPTWDAATGTSNVGRPIAGMARTNGATASSNATLHFAATPSWIDNGWTVTEATYTNLDGIPGGTTVIGKAGTTVTMSQGAGATGVGNGDKLLFHAGGGTNKVLVRWNTVLNGWVIAG